jgi:ribosomal-protein-alanine N-acetyltransferase
MIETPRLNIKPLNYSQLMKYAKCDNSLEEELNVFPIARTLSPALLEALANTIIPNMANPSKNYLYCTLWSGISKSENKMVGDLCIVDEPNENGEIETGYGTYNTSEGKGYKTEMVGGIIAWAKTQPTVKSIIANTVKNK